jgi:hypothetical protein
MQVKPMAATNEPSAIISDIILTINIADPLVTNCENIIPVGQIASPRDFHIPIHFINQL